MNTNTQAAQDSTEDSLSKVVPGAPEVNMSKTLTLQKEQAEIYRQLLETLSLSEQESAALFPDMSKSLVSHITTLQQLKGDLQDIFSRIRALKMHFRNEYPDIFDYVQSLHVEELDDDGNI
ncbi:hypothetical protein IW140_002093 [Coemansia sp. RSA 1813]|nr:KxDL motif-containing protein 1 [Coemansia sp. RSA 1646]KAJ1772595.1 hypothetical protein LPJ74_001311 [Coemansia sp. RSA 1843]KAJ2091451.1 hypothetical protein IW138_001910 [Coemansia sp. RSA 986]KAJ2213885.1 hypothetical protein EV179_003469 [Coemansia sp. RSA 487]KAJ2570667.1 hypothetical protein IW140_002093 [Coemansia sp. RSA 1813]